MAELKRILDNAIVVGRDAYVYWINDLGLIERHHINNRHTLLLDGFTYEQMSEGIKHPDLIKMTSAYGRDKNVHAEKNLDMCTSYCRLYMNRLATAMFKAYEDWLKTMKSKAESAARMREKAKLKSKDNIGGDSKITEVSEDISRAESIVKTMKANPPTTQTAKPKTTTRKHIAADVDKVCGGRVRLYQGIVRMYHGEFEVLFTLECKVLRTQETRRIWVRENAKKMATYAFDCIRKDKKSREKLNPKVHYIPTDVTITPYGDVFITFVPQPNGKG